jgi:hypothetical protein
MPHILTAKEKTSFIKTVEIDFKKSLNTVIEDDYRTLIINHDGCFALCKMLQSETYKNNFLIYKKIKIKKMNWNAV